MAELLQNLAFDLDGMEAEHIRWLESHGREGKRANLRGLDFSGRDLSGRRLAQASLRGAILTSANLSRTDLQAADLSEANLEYANLTETHLAGASFTRARLQHANAAGADMAMADFIGAIAEGMNLSNSTLSNAILRDADFSYANFTNAVLNDANLRNAIVLGADFSRADLTASDCRDIQFEHTRFTDTNLNGTNFRGASFAQIDLHAVDFSTAIDVAPEIVQQAAQHALHEPRFVSTPQPVLRTIVYSDESKALEIMRYEKLAGFSRGFMMRGAVWTVLASGILAFTINVALQLQQVNSERLYFIVGACVFTLGLAFFSIVRSFQVARLLKQIVAASTSNK